MSKYIIELTRKTDRFDGPIRTPYDIRSFKCVFGRGSGRDPVICRPRIPSSDLMGFPIMKLFLIRLSLFSTNKAWSTLRWFLSCDKLDSFTWLSLQRLPNGFLYWLPLIKTMWLWSILDCLWFGISIPWLPQEKWPLIGDFDSMIASTVTTSELAPWLLVKMGVKRWSKKTARKEREKKTGQGTILTHADVSFWFLQDFRPWSLTNTEVQAARHQTLGDKTAFVCGVTPCF